MTIIKSTRAGGCQGRLCRSGTTPREPLRTERLTSGARALGESRRTRGHRQLGRHPHARDGLQGHADRRGVRALAHPVVQPRGVPLAVAGHRGRARPQVQRDHVPPPLRRGAGGPGRPARGPGVDRRQACSSPPVLFSTPPPSLPFLPSPFTPPPSSCLFPMHQCTVTCIGLSHRHLCTPPQCARPSTCRHTDLIAQMGGTVQDGARGALRRWSLALHRGRRGERGLPEKVCQKGRIKAACVLGELLFALQNNATVFERRGLRKRSRKKKKRRFLVLRVWCIY